MHRSTFAVLALSLLAVLAAAAGCGRPAETGPHSVRLVDRFDRASVEGTPPAAPPVERTEWTFEDPGDGLGGWRSGYGVAHLRVEDGALAGRSTGAFPVILAERTTQIDPRELVEAVEVRMAVSAPAELRVGFTADDDPDLERIRAMAGAFPARFSTPLVAGEEPRTYTMTTGRTITASRVRNVLLHPVIEPGVDFRIESVRVIFRAERLAEIPSGVSWQGLDQIYRETLVTRAPEVVRVAVELPQRPRLELGLGTVEARPVTFRLALAEGDGSGEGESQELLRRTITRGHRWEEASVDLSRWAGRRVTLELGVESEREGAFGFWGSPAVRRMSALQGEAAPRGVILVIADTLRRDHLSTYGYGRDTAPRLSALAEEGAIFRDALSQGTWTKVSVSSILTSLYPTTHTVAEFDDRLPATAETLAEVYRENGYATLSLTSILFVGKFTNLHQGFEVLHEPGALDPPEGFPSKVAREAVDRLIPWLEAHRDVPFFVLLHVQDPHDPFRPYRPYDGIWADPERTEEHGAQEKAVREHIDDPLLKQFGMPTRAQLEAAGIDPRTYVEQEIGWYDGSIRGLDAEMHRLSERLEEIGLAEDTLIAFVSDHGEEFLEHGRHFHGQSVYGELNRVPLLLRGPGIPAGTVIEETVQTIDLMPTLLELSGLEVPERAQGRSLVPLLAGRSAGRTPPAVTEKAAIENVAGPPPRDTAALAIVEGRWKLVHNVIPGPGQPEIELYDHWEDPLNLHDVASEHPELVERLVQTLERWRKTAEAARLDPEEALDDLSSAELEQLRSLGYI